MNLQELLNQHPELEADKASLEKLFKAFPVPKVSPDKAFSATLKQELKSVIQEKKAENPKYLAFYLRNFRFYFSGFSVALGCFLVLFVLGFFSFNKNPELLSNPKLITFTASESFGELNPEKIWSLQTKEALQARSSSLQDTASTIPLASASSLRTIPLGNETSLFTPAPNRYHIWEDQLPKLEKEFFVAKKSPLKGIEMSFMSKKLHLPELQITQLGKSQIKNLTFTSSDGRYQFFLDLEQGLFSASQKENQNPSQPLSENETSVPNPLSEKAIKKMVKHQLSTFWLSLKHYGEAEIISDDYDTKRRLLFFPKRIDGKAVRDAESKESKGMHLIFDTMSQTISSRYGFEIQPYELSKYPFTSSSAELLQKLEHLGRIDTSKKGEKDSLPMKKGEVIYLQQGAFLIPSLLFQTKEQEHHKTIILPLF